MLCFITRYVMLCYITHDMLCYITHDMLCYNVSSTRVAEFDLLSGILDSGCLTCAYSL